MHRPPPLPDEGGGVTRPCAICKERKPIEGMVHSRKTGAYYCADCRRQKLEAKP